MRRRCLEFSALSAALLAAPAAAQDTIKIGVILPYSGQFADAGDQMDNGIKLYMKQHGDTVAGKKIEFIRKDVGGTAPDVAKRLAQELVVRDKVDILAGFALTPERARGRRRLGRGEEVHGGDERRDLDHHHQVALHGAHLGDAAAGERDVRHLGAKSGIKKAYTMVSDYGPGHDAEGAFQQRASRRPAARSSARCASRWPIRTSRPSCSAPRTSNPESIFIFIPGGAQPAALGKALAERGIDPKKIKVLGQGEIDRRGGAQEHGRHRARHHHRLALRLQPQVRAEQGVREGLSTRTYKRNPDFFSVGGYDGMHAHLRGAEEDQRQDRRRQR